jgi:antitoxin component HigA of HigAB toxin-antitoxin module
MTRKMSTMALFGAALLLLGAGLAITFLQVRPLQRETRTLMQQRESKLKDLSARQAAETEARFLAQALRVTDLDEFARLAAGPDPIVYLGQLLDESGLSREELTSNRVVDSVRVRRTEFTLRAIGQYDQVVDFLRALERGSRLVAVEIIQVEKRLVHDDLECRLQLSVFDPLLKASP